MLFRNPGRERLYVFSEPYATLDVSVFVHKDLGGIHDLASLRGFTVGVKKGDADIEYLTNHGRCVSQRARPEPFRTQG